MRNLRYRMAKLERSAAARPHRQCPECTSEEFRFVVHPPRVFGEPEPPPPEPRTCPRCGKTINDLHFVVEAPRQIGREQGDAA